MRILRRAISLILILIVLILFINHDFSQNNHIKKSHLDIYKPDTKIDNINSIEVPHLRDILTDKPSILYSEIDLFKDINNQSKQPIDIKKINTIYNKLVMSLYHISHSAFKNIDIEKIIHKAILGMLGSLDEYSTYLNPEDTKDLLEDITGEFGGIGVHLVPDKSEYIKVVGVLEDTPAEKAGIKNDDIILSIDEESMKDLGFFKGSKALRGEANTQISLSILRDGKIIDLSVERGIIKNTILKYFIEDGLLYIRLIGFKATTAKLVKDLFKELKNNDIKGIVLDLRNNPGGLVSQAVQIASIFLEEGIVTEMYTENPNSLERNKIIYVENSDIKHIDTPISILINSYTASAAEILAGALKDHRRAVIIGTNSFGKCSVQKMMPNGDDLLKITTYQYVTPNGNYIHQEGISPHIKLQYEFTEYEEEKKYLPLDRELKLHLNQKYPKENSENTINTDIGNSSEFKIQGIEKMKQEGIVNLQKSDNQFQMAEAILKSINIYRAKDK